jgi:hypothetical protein
MSDGYIILAAQVVTQADKDAAQGDALAAAWLAPLRSRVPSTVRFVRQPFAFGSPCIRRGVRWQNGGGL